MDVCAAHNIRKTNPTFTKQMIVDHRHKVLYCYVPKAACSSWKHVLCQLMKEGVSKTRDELLKERQSQSWPGGNIHSSLTECGLQYARQLSEDQIQQVISSYTKIITVRHPFERLKSVYRDKLYVDPSAPYRQCQACTVWGRTILKRYPQNHTQTDLFTGRGVTMDQFLEYTFSQDEPHWMEENRLCHPCQMQYDYILKMDTLEQDAEQVIQRVFNSTLPFITSNLSNKTITADAQVPDKLRRRFHQRYYLDMAMFGYQ